MSTRKLPSIACFWPGLPQLWLRGSWVGLLVAVGFTALLNVWLLATTVFFEWFSLQERMIGFTVLLTVWLVAWRVSVAQLRPAESEQSALESPVEEEGAPTRVAPTPDGGEQLLHAAQQTYLQGNWMETERSLLAVLKENSRDVEARLMLATLWRRQGRAAEASRQLDRLERLEAAEKWKHEIAFERTEIAKHRTDTDDTNTDDANSMIVPLEPDEPAEQQPTNDENNQRRLAA